MNIYPLAKKEGIFYNGSMKIKIIDFGIKEAGIDIPFQKHFDDVGADVRLLTDIIIPPRSTKMTGLGFGVEIPNGLAGFIFPRSGLNSRGVTMYYSPIDPGYRGEIKAILYNSTDEGVCLSKGDRIGQLVVLPFVPVDHVWDLESTRGTGGFGSTGIK